MSPEPGLSRTHVDLDDPPHERFVPLRRDLGITTFGMNLMTFDPGQQGRIHRHAMQEEVYVVLDGVLDLVVEQETHELRRGDVVRVAPQLRRKLVNRGPDRVVLLALGGSAEHRGRDGEAFPDWDASTPAPPQEIPLPDDLPADERR
ncbi:cupin domain-containing protein [Conexibacter sp. W3-3-2]|uniref:Cupin domain-containing protein n=1 Tax=Paraconexibacter algicola TaxID=2133960 RepID=A0A2T4UH31_9ACTN|nr:MULTISPECIES: cupin domain-containing protein [Solirubrobacterales]MTD44786.1 cupin domain-containing protein [Conexibacter sp. W3-3-2]PTL58527.1 cupin domain-containing protein [Paraconexibacter algicola]